MESCMPETKFTADALAKLVTTALAQDQLSGLSKMLGVIAESVDAPIAILWQRAPEPIKETLFILAEWFETPQEIPTYFHTLSREKAPVSWGALDTGKLKAKDTDNTNEEGFFKAFGILSMLSIPLDTDKTKLKDKNYALNFYWTTPCTIPKDVNDQHIKKAEFLASLLLDFYHTIIDKVSYAVVNKCNQALSQLNNKTTDFKKVASDVCWLISETLQVHEVSLYLFEDPDDSNSCRLQATTWNSLSVPDCRNIPNNNTLTDWVLTHNTHIIIFDLALYEIYRANYEQHYPLLSLNKVSLETRQKDLRRNLHIPDEGNLPPVSFIALPIVYGDTLLGVIRCCANKKAPYYSFEQKRILLSLVANQIAQARDSWLNRENINKENTALSSFLKSFVTLNDFVLNKISSNEKLPKDVFINTLHEEVFSALPDFVG